MARHQRLIERSPNALCAKGLPTVGGGFRPAITRACVRAIKKIMRTPSRAVQRVSVKSARSTSTLRFAKSPIRGRRFRFGSIVLKKSKVGERQKLSGRDFERRSQLNVALDSLRWLPAGVTANWDSPTSFFYYRAHGSVNFWSSMKTEFLQQYRPEAVMNDSS